MGDVGMTLEYPLEEWHLPEVEEFRYRRPHVCPVEPDRLGVVVSSSSSSSFPPIPPPTGSELVKHPECPLSPHFESAHFFLRKTLVRRAPPPGGVQRRIRQGHVDAGAEGRDV